MLNEKLKKRLRKGIWQMMGKRGVLFPMAKRNARREIETQNNTIYSSSFLFNKAVKVNNKGNIPMYPTALKNKFLISTLYAG